jgi:hypothetical protein
MDITDGDNLQGTDSNQELMGFEYLLVLLKK